MAKEGILKGKDRHPTINFQVRFVSFKEGPREMFSFVPLRFRNKEMTGEDIINLWPSKRCQIDGKGCH